MLDSAQAEPVHPFQCKSGLLCETETLTSISSFTPLNQPPIIVALARHTLLKLVVQAKSLATAIIRNRTVTLLKWCLSSLRHIARDGTLPTVIPKQCFWHSCRHTTGNCALQFYMKELRTSTVKMFCQFMPTQRQALRTLYQTYMA